MSTENNNAAIAGGGEASPQIDQTQQNPQQRAPRNDAEAAAQEQAAAAQRDQAQQDAAGAGGDKKNRTTNYIKKINDDRARLQRELDELRRGGSGNGNSNASDTNTQRNAQGAPAGQGSNDDPEPTLEGCDFDVAAYTRAYTKWELRQQSKARESAQQQETDTRKFEETRQNYVARIDEFAEANPDFYETVDSLEYPLSHEVQLAIMVHEKGPAIAYHIANNEDDAITLSGTPPHLAAVAVKRIAARLDAAPASNEGEPGNAGAENLLAPAPNRTAASAAKPITKAPAPAPTLGGRAGTKTPPEKMTDDEWYAADKESRRKR